jgi:hypothetical protein
MTVRAHLSIYTKSWRPWLTVALSCPRGTALMNVAILAHSGASDRTNPFAARPGRPVADAQRQGLDWALPHHRGRRRGAQSALLPDRRRGGRLRFSISGLQGWIRRQCHADHSGHRVERLGGDPNQRAMPAISSASSRLFPAIRIAASS